MNMNRPLYWNQGLLLQPHHFQLQDLYFQSLLDPYQRFMQPYLWGVGRLEIQESALGNRAFSLTGGEFLLPDGTHIILSSNALVEARSFEEDWASTRALPGKMIWWKPVLLKKIGSKGKSR